MPDLMRDDHSFGFRGLAAGNVNHHRLTIEETVYTLSDDRTPLVALKLKVFQFECGSKDNRSRTVPTGFRQCVPVAVACLESDVRPRIQDQSSPSQYRLRSSGIELARMTSS